MPRGGARRERRARQQSVEHPRLGAGLSLRGLRPVLASNGDEAEHVREREDETTGAGVHSESQVSGEIDGKSRRARVAARGAVDVSGISEAEHAEGREEVDAEHRPRALVQRDAVLAGDLARVLTASDLDDVGAEEVRRRTALEVEPEDAGRPKVGEVVDVVLLEEGWVAVDRPAEEAEADDVLPWQAPPSGGADIDALIRIVAARGGEADLAGDRREPAARR